MEKSAKTISKRKFSKLSSRRKHELLSSLAREALSTGNINYFLKRYDELQSWAELDRYIPPPWLSNEEVLDEYIAFHSNFSSAYCNSYNISSSISWIPRFAIEVIIDQIRSPYNVGSVLRILDNFSCKGLLHNSSWLRLDHPQLKKSARGCERWIPVRFESDLVSYLGHSSVPVIGIENVQGAVPVDKFDMPGECIIVLGNETYGIASAIRRCCDQTVFIPMLGFKKSMNVSHALAIILQKIVEKYETHR